jgi:RNA polymerase sigma-70 factor (ECF subfamily)
MNPAPPGPPPDADPLGLEAQRGYLRAVARLQLATRPWLLARLDASDLVQQTLLRAHAARAEFRGKTTAELVAWLRQILHRVLANALRAHAQARRDVGAERTLEAELAASSCRLDAWLAADQTSPSERVERAERVTALAAAIDALPADQREVVLMKHTLGLTLAEIAAQRGCTLAAVAGLLRRALARLREQLGEGPPCQ